MSESMIEHGRREPSQRDEHRISPELVLVDPTLADQARRWMHGGDDTLARLERVLAAHRMAASQPRYVEDTQEGAASWRSGLASRGSGLRLAVASAAALFAVTAILAGISIGTHGDPADAEQEESVGARATAAQRSTSRVAGGASTRRAPSKEKATVRPEAASRSFAWAPVDGASGYHIELFLGSSLVFSADTRAPHVVVPATWRLGGRTRSLKPGEYQWYVWPLVSGKRASRASVRARLEV